MLADGNQIPVLHRTLILPESGNRFGDWERNGAYRYRNSIRWKEDFRNVCIFPGFFNLVKIIYIPTDCPQRDERMGWTGDANIFAGTACFHMDSSAFFRHYTRSMNLEQELMKGMVPFFVPRPKVPVRENTNPFYLEGGACVWADAAAMIPWTLYRYYGDAALLREQYPMMKSWTGYIRMRSGENKVPYLWQNDHQLGDWLALDNGDIQNPIGRTVSGTRRTD